ncbi:MAG: hypothetical protein EBR10_07330 [Planctomycetes bacterium]|nr:hypothetical protein [Planctomycetota bacterium]
MLYLSPMSRNCFAAVAVAAAVSSASSAAVIAGWSIVTAFPTGTGFVPTGQNYSVGAADSGDQTAGSELRSFHTLAAATYTSPAGNGSQYSFSSNNWSIGDYYEAQASTSNYGSISVSWDQARSSTGPASFELIFSVNDGVSWSSPINYTVLQSGGGGAPGTWSSTSYNALYTNTQSLVGAENANQLLIRFRAAGAATGATGSNRIDNVVVSGTFIPAPGALALLGLAGLAGARRRG